MITRSTDRLLLSLNFNWLNFVSWGHTKVSITVSMSPLALKLETPEKSLSMEAQNHFNR